MSEAFALIPTPVQTQTGLKGRAVTDVPLHASEETSAHKALTVPYEPEFTYDCSPSHAASDSVGSETTQTSSRRSDGDGMITNAGPEPHRPEHSEVPTNRKKALCRGEREKVRYLLNDLHQILQHLPALADVLVCDDGRGQVTQDVRAHGLDGVEVPGEDKGDHLSEVSKDLIFTKTRDITRRRHLEQRRSLKQSRVLTGPSLRDPGPSVKPSLSKVTYQSEGGGRNPGKKM
ncbi:hypothetical protein EYF80_044705 [Liparis tanakae]|uniref:Uncharacterized protein n=1 Tax=Liparis tanakae TaxID=230148 RepID=A0A4Z2FVT4_9TELE|nr:hypothetical protein EYF80_044705 [Liparis tanakae]